jgi:hypothetical protein
MTRASASAASRRKVGNESKAKDSNDAGPWRPAVPMKPRPGLFVALLLVLAVWCGVMVWMYVRAIRHPATMPSPPRATAPVVAQAQ